MKIRRMAEIGLALYGLFMALDKIDRITKEEKRDREKRMIKRNKRTFRSKYRTLMQECSSEIEAKMHIDNMADIINDYGYLTVKDFKDLFGNQTEKDDKYFGWDESLNKKPYSSLIAEDNGKYFIMMPSAKPVYDKRYERSRS